MATKFSEIFKEWNEQTKAQFNLTTLKLNYIRNVTNQNDWPPSFQDLNGIEDSKLFMDCIRHLEVTNPNLTKDIKEKKRDELTDLEIQYLKIINVLPKHYTREDALMTFDNLLNTFVGQGKEYEFVPSVKAPDMERSDYKDYDDVLKDALSWITYKNFLPRTVVNSSETVCVHSKDECEFIDELKINPYLIGSLPIHHLSQFSKKSTTTVGGLLLEHVYSIADIVKKALNDDHRILDLINYKRFTIDQTKESMINIKINNNVPLSDDDYAYYRKCLVKRSLSDSDIYSPQDLEDLLRSLCRENSQLDNLVNSVTKSLKLLNMTFNAESNVDWIKLHIFNFKAYYYYYLLFERCPSPDPNKNVRELLPLTQRKLDVKSASFFKRYDFVAKFFSNNDLSEGKKNAFLNFPIDNFMFYEYARMLGIAPCSRLFTSLNYLISLTDEIDIDYLTNIGLHELDRLAISVIYNSVSEKEIHYLFSYHRHCPYRDPKHFNIAGLVATLIEIILGRGKDMGLFRANFSNWCEHMSFANYDTLTYLHNDFISNEEDFKIHKSEELQWERNIPVFDLPNFVNLVYGLFVESLEGVKRCKHIFPLDIMKRLAQIFGISEDNIDKDREGWETLRAADYDKYLSAMKNHNNLMVFKTFSEQEYNTIGEELVQLFNEGFEKDRVLGIYKNRQDSSIVLSKFHLVDYNGRNTVNDYSDDNNPSSGGDSNDEDDKSNSKHDDKPQDNSNPFSKLAGLFTKKANSRGNKQYTQEQRKKYKEYMEKLGWDVYSGTVEDPDGNSYVNNKGTTVKANEFFELLDESNNIIIGADGKYSRFEAPREVHRDEDGYYLLKNNRYFLANDGEKVKVTYSGWILNDDDKVTKYMIKPYEVKIDNEGKPYKEKVGDYDTKIRTDLDGFILNDEGNRIFDSKSKTYERFLGDYKFDFNLKAIREGESDGSN